MLHLGNAKAFILSITHLFASAEGDISVLYHMSYLSPHSDEEQD